MDNKNWDFRGWATKNDLKCSDGRTIMKDAFKHNDGQTVPLVWNHQHNDPLNVLGHAVLKNCDEGVRCYGFFNDTDAGKAAKTLVQNHDISALSIYANQLKQQGSNVLHGAIREVSLVLAGANPGAYIDSIISHGDESEDEAIIYTGEEIVLEHSDDSDDSDESKENEESLEHSKEDKSKMADTKKTDESKKSDSSDKKTDASSSDSGKDETVADVFNTLNDKQKTVVYAMIAQAMDDSNDESNASNETDSSDNTDESNNTDESKGGKKIMKHNVFDNDSTTKENTLSHSDMEAIFADAKRYGSLKESVNQHGVTEDVLQHSITNVDYLFPDAQNVNQTPGFITRDQTWVASLMTGTHHTPFSRIKSIYANLTEDDARAKGYIKGKLKVEEVFSLLKRTTTPTTIYKKQKLDRDDVVDITDFDVIAWLKSEMRLMLDEEIARAVLVGDGRLTSSDDKINEQNIRPIWTDDDLYTIKQDVSYSGTATNDQKAKAFIQAAIRSRKNYKGSGTPTLYTTEDVLTSCLLMEDTTGRVIFDTIDKLTTALRVKEIVTVPVMEGLTRTVNTVVRTLMGIIVNPTDYNIGADKGGAVNLFDDFDIDYNAQKYLIETRCSGALTVPYSAIALEGVVAAG